MEDVTLYSLPLKNTIQSRALPDYCQATREDETAHHSMRIQCYTEGPEPVSSTWLEGE